MWSTTSSLVHLNFPRETARERHGDGQSGDEEATDRFQVLSEARTTTMAGNFRKVYFWLDINEVSKDSNKQGSKSSCEVVLSFLYQ